MEIRILLQGAVLGGMVLAIALLIYGCHAPSVSL